MKYRFKALIQNEKDSGASSQLQVCTASKLDEKPTFLMINTIDGDHSKSGHRKIVPLTLV